MAWWGELVVAAAVLVGLAGVVVPVLPGLLLSWVAVVVWGVWEGGATGWSVVAVVTVLAAVSQVLKYTVPGRRLQRAGVAGRSITVGGLCGIVGFFVVPVLGLALGFALGVYVAERARLETPAAARTSTRHALRAAALSILLELAAGLLIALVWGAGLIVA